MAHKYLPSKTSKLSSKLRYAFDLTGIKVKLVNVSLGLDQQYEYKSIISVMPEGIEIGEFRHINNQSGIKYNIYTPDGEELGVYYLFSLMFQDLVTAIANNRINQNFDNIQLTFDGSDEE